MRPAGADCQWLDTLRLRQIASHTSLQRSQSNPMLGSHFPYFSDQDSYAAAVRRTQAPVKHQQITPINQSRSSSPTQYALTKNFSSLHLSSRDSGFSSLTPDSSAERAQYSGRSRSKYERGSGSLSASPRGRAGGQGERGAPARDGYAGPLGRGRAPARSPGGRRPRWAIPGMPLHPEAGGAGGEESRASEGGWTKVQHRRKAHRPAAAKAGRERARGSCRGRRTV